MKNVSINESIAMTGTPDDGDASVIRGVKVLGNSSQNRREYTPEAVMQGARLYEGLQVNIDHPERGPNQTRSLRDRFGRLVNVEAKDGELYADLRFNPKHPIAEQVKWFAKHDPAMLGLSHNAVGQGEQRGGVFVVEKIVSVRSVDLVADPATTKGLFESVNRGENVKITLKAFLEGIESKFDTVKRKKIRKLLEAPGDEGMGGEMGTVPVMEPTADAEPDDQLWQGFLDAITKIASEHDKPAKERGKQILKYLKAHEGLKDGDSGDGDKDDSLEGDGDKDYDPEDDYNDDRNEPGSRGGPDVGTGKKKKGDMDESLRVLASKNPGVRALLEKVDRLETKDRVDAKRAKAASLCESARLPKEAITAIFMESLLAAADDKAMRALVEDRKRIVATKRPVSAGSVAASITDAEFAKKLKAR